MEFKQGILLLHWLKNYLIIYIHFFKPKVDPQLMLMIIALIKSLELHPIVLSRSYAEAVRYCSTEKASGDF